MYCGANLIETNLITETTLNQVEQNTVINTQLNVEPKKGSNGFAIAGFICSIFQILGWIFGGIGLAKSKTLGKGKGLSIAAIVIASASFIIGLLM